MGLVVRHIMVRLPRDPYHLLILVEVWSLISLRPEERLRQLVRKSVKVLLSLDSVA